MATPFEYRKAAGFRRNEAETQSPVPIRQASPATESAKPDTSGRMFTRAYDGFSIPVGWLKQLARHDDTALTAEGVTDLALFDTLLDDWTAYSTFQQRILALIARPWTVEPGDPDDQLSVRAANDFRAMMDALGWDRISFLMGFGRWYGFAVAEGIYDIREHDGRQLVWLSDIVVPDRKWYAFTNAGELRQRAPGSAEGEPVPENKFWSYRTGGTHDFALYGKGLAHWCYWPIWFKKNGFQFWALYLEKLGQPTVVGYFQPGTDEAEIDKLLGTLQAVGTDSAVALPAPPAPPVGGGAAPDLKPHLMEATRAGNADTYRQFIEVLDDAIRAIILGQPGTSKGVSSGLNSNQADVHKDVRDEVVKADSDGLHEGFNRTFPAWITRWNYGPNVKPPVVYRQLDDDESIDDIATRDKTLKELGWQRTEKSFREIYGDGYERAPEPEPVDPRLAAGGNRLPKPANDRNPAKVANFAAGDEIPLYVSRKLLNGGDLIAWARKVGLQGIEDKADLHVTVLASRTPVDPFDLPDDYWSDADGGLIVRPGGPRKVATLGDECTVVRFVSKYMRYRQADMIEAGASSDFPEFLPHVTIAKGPQTVDLDAIEPYAGELRFGPEIFVRMDTDPADDVVESLTFSAAQLDVIDEITASLAADTDPVFGAMAEAMRATIADFSASGRSLSADQLKVALLQALERFPIEKLAGKLAVPMLATHAAAAANAEAGLEP